MKRIKIKLTNTGYIQQLQDYKDYINILGYSQNGQQIKEANVREFLEWLEQQEIPRIKEVKPSDIKEHYEYLKTRPHKKQEGILSLKTIIHQMRSIRVFFNMLQETGKITENPMSILKFYYPREKAKERIILSIEEIKELYRATENMQEKAILSLSYGCGLRSMELVQANIDDIKDGIIIVPKGKGNKRRVIPMSRKVEQDINNYIEYERTLYNIIPEEKAILLNIAGRRLRKYTCRKILKKIITRTENQNIIKKQISIHNLRHSIATHLLEQGVPIEQVRTFLGHSQLETTEIYTRVNAEQLKKLMNHE
jgi:integrase/recombinase XerD